MDRLVSREQLAKAARLKSNNPLVGILYRFSGIDKVNRFYDQIYHLKDFEFIEQVFELLELPIEVDPEELKRLPTEGAFITVSNHPFGALDGMALLNVVSKERKDFKMMANFLLQRIEQLGSFFFAVNPFGDEHTASSSFKGMKDALKHLQDGHSLGIFPAGEASAYRKDLRTITDGPWAAQSIKLIRKAEVPVVPIYFDGKNSRLFHLLGVIHPALRTLRLPAEMMNKRGKKLRMRIGKPIPAKDIAAFEDLDQLSRFLRAKTYALGTPLDVRKEYFFRRQFPKKAKPVVDAVDPADLLNDINVLPESAHLFDHQNIACYVGSARQLPHVLKEIGRLREVTFRAVGEGTNNPCDIDEYDLYYQHLFLWDKEKHAIIGAYRIGLGGEIIRRYGSRGFYTCSLFRMSSELNTILNQSIELGRSFITAEYQKQRMPLFLLWKGILAVLITSPEYRYVIGPVTISGSYKDISKGLIIEFVKRHYYDHELAAFVKPRTPYRPKASQVDQEALLNATENDLKKLDKMIAEIEPSSFTIPVLLKKYLHQNARILGFNLDPKFNNALDGLMLLDLHNLPAETVENLQKEFGAAL